MHQEEVAKLVKKNYSGKCNNANQGYKKKKKTLVQVINFFAMYIVTNSAVPFPEAK